MEQWFQPATSMEREASWKAGTLKHAELVHILLLSFNLDLNRCSTARRRAEQRRVVGG